MLSTQDTRDFNVRLTGKGLSGATGTSPWVLVEVTHNSSNTNYSVVKNLVQKLLQKRMVWFQEM